MLVARIVVDVDGHAAQRRDLVGQLVQTGVVLALALVRLGHFRSMEGGFLFLSWISTTPFQGCRTDWTRRW